MKTMPDYRPVAFRDTTTGHVMVIGSTVPTKDTLEHGGRVLPVYDLDVSSHSHPAYTQVGRERPKSGRIEAFRRRYGH